jgi:hypothetical protein
MTYKLVKVEELVDNKDYNKLEVYLNKYKDYSYSFIDYLKFMRDEYDILRLDNIINNFLLKSEEDKTEKIIRKDAKYKNNVKELCNNICIVTGNTLCNEVAHIHEFKDCDYDDDKYCKFNGLYLQNNIHELWDKYKLLKAEYCIETKDIYFIINKEILYNDGDNIETLKEILRKCNYQYTGDYSNITLEDIKIPININKDYFNYYKYYIDKRNKYNSN